MHRLSRLRGLLGGSLAIGVALIVTAGAVMAGARIDSTAGADAAADLTLRAVDAHDGRLVPSRIRIARIGSFELPRVIIADADEQHVRLTTGEYRIWASHGPEWSVASAQLFVRAPHAHRIELTMQREVRLGRYAGCDLHVHTARSYDSQVTLNERLRSAAAEGLNAVVITDHNRVLPAVAQSRPARVLLMRGVEITTWDPEFGHFNMFPSRAAPKYKHSSPEQLLAALPVQSARFVQVNHPRLLRHIGFFELAAEHGVMEAMRPGFDGIEVWNGYDLHRPSERDRVLADWLGLVARGRRVVATGGSDSHDLTHTLVGYPRTYVDIHGDPSQLDEQTLAAALRQGHAFVSNGPILQLEVGGRVPGETLVLSRAALHISVRVRVDAPAWMDLQTLELWVDGKHTLTRGIEPLRDRTKPSEGPRADFMFDLPAGGARSVLAVVRGVRAMDELFDGRAVKPFAFTNPVWIVRR